MLFMENGGNSKALTFFRKYGIISKNHGIDYKSSYIQEYRSMIEDKVNRILRLRKPQMILEINEAKQV